MLSRLFRQADRTAARGYFVSVQMPLCLPERDAERAFVRPLERKLAELRYGRITGYSVDRSDTGEPQALTITLSLVTQAPRAFAAIADYLESLDAPAGSWLGNAEAPEMLMFGRSTGLCLYLDSREAAEDADVLDIVEACTEALEGAGLYQGSARLGDRHALYFYGDSFNAMRKAMTFVISTDPRCRNAVTRRIE